MMKLIRNQVTNLPMVGLVFLLFLFNSCKNPDGSLFTEPVQIESIALESGVQQKLDSLDQVMWHYYVDNPDSAEIILHYTANLLDSLKIPQKKFYTYMHLAQFYQFRKPNYENAVRNLAEAMRIFVHNPGSYLSNNYVFIDVGNLFFNMEYYKEAIHFYKISYSLARQFNKTNAQALAFQNIALAHQKLGNNDSAFYYLFKSQNKITPDNLLMQAQNNNYLADLSFHSDGYVDEEKLAKESITLVLENKKTIPETTDPQSIVFMEEILAVSHEILSKIYHRSGKFDLADAEINKAIAIARENKLERFITQFYFTRTLHRAENSDYQTLKNDIDTTWALILNSKDYVSQKTFADSMIVLFKHFGLPDLRSDYLELSRQISDSLLIQQASTDMSRDLMLLFSVSAEQAVQKLQIYQKIKNDTISHQRIIIVLIIIFSMAVLMALLIIFRQNHRLKLAHHAMVAQLRNVLRESGNEKNNATGNVVISPDFEKDLTHLMVVKKSYLDKNLSLNSLAGLLNTNQTYLSNYLNKRNNSTFNDYINEYRIKEACRLLFLPESQNFTIEALAGMSGFNSKSTFYSAFKKSTGMSPSDFRKTQKNS